MPLYEYKCEKCGKVFEVIQRFSDQPLAAHEHCGGAVHRLLSAPALQFKGSGWYITDYAKGKSSDNGGPKKGDSTKGESTGGNSPSSSESGSKPAETSSSSSSAETKSSSSDTK